MILLIKVPLWRYICIVFLNLDELSMLDALSDCYSNLDIAISYVWLAIAGKFAFPIMTNIFVSGFFLQIFQPFPK